MIQGYIPPERNKHLLKTCGYCRYTNCIARVDKYIYQCSYHQMHEVDEYGTCPRFDDGSTEEAERAAGWNP